MPGSPIPQAVTNPFDTSGVDFSALPLVRVFAGGSIQSAIDRLTAGGTILVDADEYEILTEIATSASYLPIRIIGAPWSYNNGSVGTRIKAMAAMRSVVALLSTSHSLHGVRINANRLANYGVYLNNAASSELSNVLVEDALFDGVHGASTGNNNSVTLREVWAINNGTLYHTAAIVGDYALYSGLGGTLVQVAGTAATTANNVSIVITGGPDLTTYGIRKGDPVRAGTYYGQIESVSATTITVQTGYRPSSTAAGLDWAIGVGHGIHATRQADNNIWKLHGGLWRANAGSGFAAFGIFGPRVVEPQTDYNGFYGVEIGSSDNASPIFGGGIYLPYYEGHEAHGGAQWLHYWTGFKVEEPIYNTDTPRRPVEVTAGIAAGNIVYQGNNEHTIFGVRNNFVIRFRENGGSHEHLIASERFNNGLAVQATKLADKSNAFVTTPLVSNVVGFSEGVGVLNSSQSLLLLDTPIPQSTNIVGQFNMEFDSSGTAHRVYVRNLSNDINGVTQNRYALVLTDSAGAAVAWTSLAAGAEITVRVDVLLR
jgi:hypothetical protein